VAVAEVRSGEALEAGDMLLGHITQGGPQLGDTLARKRVIDASAVPSSRQHAGTSHCPQMVRRVGDALPDLLGDVVDRALPLSEDVDDLSAPTTAQRLCYLCEALEQGVLRDAVTHDGHRA